MAIEIKGITVPALLLKIDNAMSLDDNIRELESKLSNTFFSGSMVVIKMDESELRDEEKEKLEEVLKKHNTKVLGYKPLSEKKDKDRPDSLTRINEKKSLKIINKTLRSGQKVEYDGDILIMGNVNPDAYVVASGNIIVIGTLRGIIHAGANGDESSVIIALKLQPQQMRIGSYVTRSPDNLDLPEHPEKAFVENNQIFIDTI